MTGAVDMIGDVRAFHEKFNTHYDGPPRMLLPDLFQFRKKFHYEELTEYDDEQEVLEDIASAAPDHRAHLQDRAVDALENQLDALVDAAWVILGTAEQQFGVERFRAAWRRVVTANMAKERAIPTGDSRSKRDAAFDIVKPEGWTPPCHRDLVIDHAPLPELP